MIYDIPITNEQILERLQILHDKLEMDGAYVSSNTVWLAMELIKKLIAEKNNG